MSGIRCNVNSWSSQSSLHQMESGERLEMVLKGVLFAKLLLEVWLAAHWERKLKKQDRDSGTQGMGPKPFDLQLC